MLLSKRPILNLEKTGQIIRKIRIEKGISVRTLQNALGFVNPQAIYNWESGKNMPSIDNLVILAEIFEVSLEDLISVDYLGEDISLYCPEMNSA